MIIVNPVRKLVRGENAGMGLDENDNTLYEEGFHLVEKWLIPAEAY
ncbi:MAG: hypothetical protein ACRCR9_01360 [Chitinophagaceae bacterium]